MEQFKSVPFGNSVFQIMNFTAGKETPQRRYRHCLLQLSQKLNVLKECELRRKRIDIDIAELEENILKTKGFDKQRLKIDLEEKLFHLDNELKLIEDCAIEVNTYKHILNDLPEFTREEFELGEPKYWEARLLGDAKQEMLSTGSVNVQTISSLENMGISMNRNEQGQLTYVKQDVELIEKE